MDVKIKSDRQRPYFKFKENYIIYFDTKDKNAFLFVERAFSEWGFHNEDKPFFLCHKPITHFDFYLFAH